MKQKKRENLIASVGLLAAFVLWTILVCNVDVQPIGPGGSKVGFATANSFLHRITGVHRCLYVMTDWLSLIPLGIAAGFALLGLVQWIQRKKLAAVDRGIIVLGGFYAVTVAVFALFEVLTVNYRPVLIDGVLEKSYPSSTTVLVMCVMSTALMQFRDRIKNKRLQNYILALMQMFSVFMILGRFLSGVHWSTDIIGGMLLSAGLIKMYMAING